MKKLRIIAASALAAVGLAASAAPASADSGLQRAVAYQYAMDKCARYHGCSGLYTSQLIIVTSPTSANYNRFFFDTWYCGRKYYAVSVGINGGAFGGNLYGGSC